MFDIKPGAVIHGDCLTVLRQMPDSSVDMIITDPPYGVDFQSNRPRSKDPTARFEKIANDKAPFIWWLYDAFRVLKEGGEHWFSAGGMCNRCSWTQCALRALPSNLYWFGIGCITAWAI